MLRYKYNQLVFQRVANKQSWRSPYHWNSGWYSVMVTLSCGHTKSYSRHNVPKDFALCHQCTLLGRKAEIADFEARKKRGTGVRPKIRRSA